MNPTVWTALDLNNVSTAFLANLVGRLPANHAARRAMVEELTNRRNAER